MDLSTVLSNIDLHQYGTVKEYLEDVDLIWQNALEYNPDKDPSGTVRAHIHSKHNFSPWDTRKGTDGSTQMLANTL